MHVVVGDDLSGGHGPRGGLAWGPPAPRFVEGSRGLGVGGAASPGTVLTWRVVGIMRFSPSTEMLTAMLMPAKRRLLLPRMEERALLGA